MKDGITVIVVSRKDETERKDFITHVIDSCGCDCDVFFSQNTEGYSLTYMYNTIYDSIDKKHDIVVFMHDDIEFLRNGWGSKLIEIFDKNKEYGIIGVAGSAHFDENAAWWQNKDIYGQVLHRNNGKSWLTQFSPLFNDEIKEVVVVDGLFIAVNVNRITKKFDSELDGFDFYDVDFCLSNYIDGKCKIGVTTDIRIAHNSIGELKDGWYKNRDYINKKFGKYYPIDVNKP